MRIRIKAPYEGAQSSGVYGQDGEIPIGTEIDVKDEPTGWAGRYEVISGGDSDEGKTPVLNPELGEVEVGATNESGRTGEPVGDVPVGPGGVGGPAVYAVKEKGSGWLVITKDGEEATKSFRKSELDGFDAMSDEDKADFVKANPKD
ncbi:hypothetical protein GCM10011390_41740 [Aureimonas endophytica]|uniref:Uncharacterized protein n=1 Tax=Aureimonas endophytica TaxID=2027858 RepID=A0A917EAF4_9HYPH|nr:hypothetical protein [Aureimonas endophytica]GGE18218.1 hypothetical protein GCM10011390_41740 [Aureimonas endophytica]